MTLVLDASIALDWCFESERSAYAESVLSALVGDNALVPSIWPAEVANGLLSAQRRGRVTAAGVTQAVLMLGQLDVRLIEPRLMHDLQTAIQIGERFSLNAYDACYLSVAMQHGVPIATNDAALRRAAAAAGVSLFACAPVGTSGS